MTATINASTSSGVVITPDNSGDLALQSAGTTKFTVSSSGVYGQLVSGTAQASTSGTAITFTGIPSWAKRITFMFRSVSANGTSNWLVQLGTSGGFVTSGYLGSTGYTGPGSGGANQTAGFGMQIGGGAQVMHGQMVISLVDAATNTWVETGTLGDSSQAYIFFSGGSVALSGTATQIRLTTVNGTDVFDSGTVNILYEG